MSSGGFTEALWRGFRAFFRGEQRERGFRSDLGIAGVIPNGLTIARCHELLRGSIPCCVAAFQPKLFMLNGEIQCDFVMWGGRGICGIGMNRWRWRVGPDSWGHRVHRGNRGVHRWREGGRIGRLLVSLAWFLHLAGAGAGRGDPGRPEIELGQEGGFALAPPCLPPAKENG